MAKSRDDWNAESTAAAQRALQRAVFTQRREDVVVVMVAQQYRGGVIEGVVYLSGEIADHAAKDGATAGIIGEYIAGAIASAKKQADEAIASDPDRRA